VEPALLFLDEATSALNEPSEAQLYGLLRAATRRPTVVSVGHRSMLRNFHDQVLDVGTFSPRRKQRPARARALLDWDGRICPSWNAPAPMSNSALDPVLLGCHSPKRLTRPHTAIARFSIQLPLPGSRTDRE
jgi:hypothetical protein